MSEEIEQHLVHPVSIGNLHLEGNVFLAPMAGYTDKIYRSICLSKGACLAYTEMVSSEGLARNSEKTMMLMDCEDNEKNLAVQLFMPDAETAKRSIPNVMKAKPRLIDINSGCPVPKVVKTGAGSALLHKPETIYSIVKALVDNTDRPITIKIRTGWDTESINYLETADAAFSAGASAVAMHARTRSQLYMPYADWSKLTDLKNHFPDRIIIGSGDLFTAKDGLEMLRTTKVDAIMYARGAIGNPFIFQQTKALADGAGDEVLSVPTQLKKDEIMKHLKGLATFLGENAACREMRKHVCAYLKGIPGSAKAKQAVSQALSIDEYAKALELLGN